MHMPHPHQILWNPLESDRIYEILSIIFFMKPIRIWWDSWDLKDKILWNQLESDGIHGV